jgi:hypothetical protein
LQCQPSKGKVLKEYIKILSAMATCGQSKEKRRMVEHEIDRTIKLTQGPMARL